MTSAGRICPGCGESVEPGTRFCPSCGAFVARLSTGQILDGRYEILDKVGEGGMGEVYRARHVHLDEIRIIKVTRPDLPSEGAEPRRFQEEARMATQVRHPNVAALYDFARQPDGSYYMAWEFIDGITLQSWLAHNGPMPLPRAIEVARQALEGLGEIHRQGIVHRDISPDNLMLREMPDGTLRTKIIDLGIAKRVAAESMHMTSTGMFLGKLKYASPEQAGSLHAGEAIDGRSDLYSLGVVLFEMLTGKPPFEATTPQEYLGKHLHQAPPPLDTSSLPREVGTSVAAIVRKALAKDRDERFRDAAEFGEALGGIGGASGASGAAAREGSSGSRRYATVIAPETTAERRRTGWIAAAVIAAVLAAGAAVWALAHRRPRGAADVPATAPITTAAAASAHAPAAEPTAAPAAAERTITPESAAAVAVTSPAVAVTVSVTSATSATAGTPRPTRKPTRVAQAATASAEPAGPVVAPTPALSGAAQQRLEQWLAHPIGERARRSHDIVQWATKVIAAHPDSPDARRLRSDLPGILRQQTLDALDERHPIFARMFHNAYLSLDFAPADADLARRVNAMPVPTHPR